MEAAANSIETYTPADKVELALEQESSRADARQIVINTAVISSSFTPAWSAASTIFLALRNLLTISGRRIPALIPGLRRLSVIPSEQSKTKSSGEQSKDLA